MEIVDALGWALFGWLVGLLTFIGYGAVRALGSDGWDDSNLLNWIRLLSHVVMHPEDFARMWYINPKDASRYRPFDYIDKDEFAENFPTSRPDDE